MIEDIEKGLVETDFAIPMDVEFQKSGDDGPWVWKGVASVEVPDAEDEVLVIKGMDTSYLDTHGIANWDHGRHPGAIVGEVTKSEKVYPQGKPAELHLEGILYKSLKAARELRDLIKAVESDSLSGRKMKLSLQGKAVSKEGKRVVKSRISAVAFTMQPINTLTYATLSKGMCKHPEDVECVHCGGCMEKSLEAGPDGNGKVLQKESLEGGEKCNCGKDCKCKDEEKEEEKKKSISTRGDAVDYLVKSKKYTEEFAGSIVNFLFPIEKSWPGDSEEHRQAQLNWKKNKKKGNDAGKNPEDYPKDVWNKAADMTTEDSKRYLDRYDEEHGR